MNIVVGEWAFDFGLTCAFRSDTCKIEIANRVAMTTTLPSSTL